MPPKIFFIKCKDLALYYCTIFCHNEAMAHSTSEMFPLFIHLLRRFTYPGRLTLFTLSLVWHLPDMGKWSWHNMDKEKVQTKQRHSLRPLPMVLGKSWIHISPEHYSWVAKSLTSHSWSTSKALGLYFFTVGKEHKNKENYDQMMRVVICRCRRW